MFRTAVYGCLIITLEIFENKISLFEIVNVKQGFSNKFSYFCVKYNFKIKCMRGKEKCKILREIRQRIASENDIPFVTSECQHKGECKGTCPKCEAELRFLERELEKRGKWKMLIPATGIAALSLASCGDPMEGDIAFDPIPVDTTVTDTTNPVTTDYQFPQE